MNTNLDLNGLDNTIGSLSGKGIISNSAGGGEGGTRTCGIDGWQRQQQHKFRGSARRWSKHSSIDQIRNGHVDPDGRYSYTGGTTISAGTLQLGNGGTSGSILGDVGNVADNGILAFDRSDTTTFTRVISGLGSVTQIGTGTTILTGTNTYTGGTTISAGTLQLGNGGTTGSIVGDVIDNGALTFDLSDAASWSRLPERSAARVMSVRSGLGRRI